MTSEEEPIDIVINTIDPGDLSKHDIDRIIIKMRAALAQYEATGKPVKDKPKVDMSEIREALMPKVEKPKLRRL